MGQKTHPYGFRLGIIKDWKAHWYAPNSSSYRNLVIQDLRLRESINILFSAFDAADATTLATVLAQGEGNRLRLFKASSTRWPLTRSKMGLSLFCEAPSCLANALTGGNLLPHHPAGPFGP